MLSRGWTRKVVGRLTGLLVGSPFPLQGLPPSLADIVAGPELLHGVPFRHSIFCAAQFVTSYGWGVFSDKYGRKPVLLMSIISGAVSALVFGMAGNYLTAALARLAGGLLNATGG